ncbi:MAG: helix-turn-helix transcriptional regulator [Syntrophomonadaceae bacterium]|nr:helix-turn-helix transcriptional regulator [Syntrophomonadaceae bacterium]
MLAEYQLHKYNSIVQTVYASSDINELRLNVLCGLQQIIPCHSAAFFVVNSNSHEFSEPLLQGLSTSSFVDYNNYYQGFDIYKLVVFSQNNIPVTDRSSDYMNYRDWASNEHRADFLMPLDIYHMACMQVFHEGKICGEISLHRNKQQQDFSNDEMLLLKLLQEHVNTRFSALTLLQNIRLTSLCTSLLTPLLLLIDRHGQLLGATGTARELISRRLVSGQNVYSHLKEVCEYWYQHYKSSASPVASRHARGVLELAEGKYGYQIFLLQDESNLKSITYLVVFNDKYAPELTANFLTTREAQIASLITRGKTNKQIACELGVTENTVKTFVKRLFSKMEVHSRSQLISVMYKLDHQENY